MSGSITDPGRVSAVFLHLCLLGSLAGCGRGVPDNTVVEERLGSGAARLTYTSFSPRFVEFDVTAEWDIWSPGAPYIFSEVTDVVGGEESFFLLDGGNLEVVEFGPDGDLRNVFGREGSGPGEFRSPLHLLLHEKQLWVSDVGNRRFSIFESDGTYSRDVRWPGASRLVNRFAITTRGGILHGGVWPLTVAELAEQEPLYYLAEFAGEGQWEGGEAPVILDTMATMYSLPWSRFLVSSEEGARSLWLDPPVFAPEMYWAAREEEIVTVTSPDYRFEVHDMRGRVLLEVVIPDQDLRVTDAHRQWFFEVEAPRRLEQEGAFTLTPDSKARFVFARDVQAIAGVAVDRTGRIFIEANTPEPGVRRLDLFDNTGRYEGSLRGIPLPAAFSCAGHILLRYPDPDGMDGFRVGFIRF